MRKVPAIDLLLFWGLIGTIGVAHSLLLTSGTPWETTTWFYIVTWISAMIILLFCRVLYKEHEQLDYDEPVTQNKLVYLIGGLAATVFVASTIVRTFTRSSIWVPQPQMTLAIGSLNLTAVINDLFYQVALVANSEETMCLSLSQVLRRKFAYTSTKNRFLIVPLAIGIPRVGWAILHGYVSYVGPLMLILVVSAFISGCIISYCAYNKDVKSFLVAVFIHAAYNGLIILASALGLV